MYSPRWEHSTGQTPVRNERNVSYVRPLLAPQTLTLIAVVAAETGIALAVSGDTLAVVGASVRAILGHVLGDSRVEGQLLLIPVIVVDREEPVTRFHVLGYLTTHRGLRMGSGRGVKLQFALPGANDCVAYVCGSRGASVESAEHLLEVVLGVGGERVSASVDTDRCSARDVVIEFDVRRLSQVELHVPVAVRVDGLGQLLAQLDLREGRAIGREAASWKSAGSCGDQRERGNSESVHVVKESWDPCKRGEYLYVHSIYKWLLSKGLFTAGNYCYVPYVTLSCAC